METRLKQFTLSALGLIILIGLAAAFAMMGERNRSEMPALEWNGIDKQIFNELLANN
jgi:hypothetical protein